MKTRAAVVYAINQPVVVNDIELDPPKSGEVMLKLSASGVCHSDLAVMTVGSDTSCRKFWATRERAL